MDKTADMNRTTLRNNKGVALVLTVMTVSILAAITVQLSSSVNWQMQGAGNMHDTVQLDAVCRSGLSIARAALKADQALNNFDTEHEDWFKLAERDFSGLFEEAAVKLELTDQSGLIQVNALVPVVDQNKRAEFKPKQDIQIELWKNLLNNGKFEVEDEAHADEIIGSIIDWIDADDTEMPNGAEKGYYQSQSPSYEPKNGPIDAIEDLLLIRGMTKELFYGKEGKLALKDFVTAFGRDGQVNINTGPVPKSSRPDQVSKILLMALDPAKNMTEEEAEKLIEFREDEDNETALSNESWYKTVLPDLNLRVQPPNPHGKPPGQPPAQPLTTVQSRYFKVTVTATYKNMQRTGAGILERPASPQEQTAQGSQAQKLLYWEVR